MNKQEKGFIKKVTSLTGKAISNYKMIDEDDKILIAVSGGKDSLSLLDLLAERRKFIPINYELHAVHVATTDVPYEIDVEYLSNLCAELDVSLHIIKTYAGIEEKASKKPCFTCSWNRRKELFDYARKNSFKKIAFGHHMDDVIETLIMNMMMHGNISSIPGRLDMFNEDIAVIRPLVLLTNDQMQKYAQIKNFVSLKKDCPYEDHTLRNEARKLVKQMEKLNPQARLNIFKSMRNIDLEYLP